MKGRGLTNRATTIGIGVVVLVVVAFAFYSVMNRRKPMSAGAAEPTAVVERSRPLMDVQAPAVTETATFALG